MTSFGLLSVAIIGTLLAVALSTPSGTFIERGRRIVGILITIAMLVLLVCLLARIGW